MDTRLALTGTPVNFLASIGAGQDLAARQAQMGRTAQEWGLYRQHGEGIASGDQNAINALARFDPTAALGVRQTHQSMSHADERMGLARAAAARAAQSHAASLSAAERAEEGRRLALGAARLVPLAQGDDLTAFNQQARALGILGEDDPEITNLMDARILVAGVEGALPIFQEMQETFGGGSSQPDSPVRSNLILEDGTTIQALDTGVRVVSPTGQILEGDAAAQAILAARQMEIDNERAVYAARGEGRLGAQIDLGGEAAAASAAGTELGRQSVGIGVESYQRAQTLRGMLSNYSDAIAAIDAGAEAGLVYNRLPRIGLEGATLQNAMDRLGLDVVGSVTFGALSESELRLAMETAVPRNLSAPELRQWLTQRQSAMEASVAMLEDAAEFLTSGGTIDEWITQNRDEPDSAAQAEPVQEQQPRLPWSGVSQGARAVLLEQYTPEQLRQMFEGFAQ